MPLRNIRLAVSATSSESLLRQAAGERRGVLAGRGFSPPLHLKRGDKLMLPPSWYLPWRRCSLIAAAAGPGDVYWSTSSGEAWSAVGSWGLCAILDDAYIINGGTVTVTNVDSAAVCKNLWLGDPNSSNSGTMLMSGGNLSPQLNENVGNLGAVHVFMQTGGTNNVGNNLSLGNNPGILVPTPSAARDCSTRRAAT